MMIQDKYLTWIILIFTLIILCIVVYTIEKLDGPRYIISTVTPNTNHSFNEATTSNVLRETVYEDQIIPTNLDNSVKNPPKPVPLVTTSTFNTQALLRQKKALAQKIFNENELHCLALNNYFEAKSESITGQRAVASVVLNRVRHAGFPNTICGVVKQGGYKKLYRCQFSWWCDGLSDRPVNQRAWNQSVMLAKEILKKRHNDMTSGALWYHADYVSPYWRSSMNQGPKIGKHIFYSARKRSSTKTRKTT